MFVSADLGILPFYDVAFQVNFLTVTLLVF